METFRYIKWTKLSGAVMTGHIVKEDKKYLYVKSDKYPSDREFDFTIPQYALRETPHVFEISEPPSSAAFNSDDKDV